MRVDLEKFRERLAAFDDEVVLEMAPAVIAEIEYLRAEIARLREAAADEIERLRLTDAEREAVAFAATHGETVDASWRFALRGLLERTK